MKEFNHLLLLDNLLEDTRSLSVSLDRSHQYTYASLAFPQHSTSRNALVSALDLILLHTTATTRAVYTQGFHSATCISLLSDYRAQER